jgi:hypothetical protein
MLTWKVKIGLSSLLALTVGQRNGNKDKWNGQVGGNVGTKKGNDGYGNGEHCVRADVQIGCVEGSGSRVYNTGQGEFWDPEHEDTYNQNDGWDWKYQRKRSCKE